MKKEKKSLFEEIKKEIEKEYSQESCLSKINGWCKLMNNRSFEGKIKNFIEITIKRAAEFFNTKINDYKPRKSIGRGKLRKRVAIKKEEIKAEHLLERLLTVSSDNLYNQFNFLSGLTEKNREMNAIVRTSNIDLVIASDNKINELIELKAEKNSKDNPLSAMLELIMYCCLYAKVQKSVDKTLPGLSKELRLTVLAPEGYYNFWKEDKKGNIIEHYEEKLKKITNLAENEINENIKVSFEKIAVDKKQLEVGKNFHIYMREVFRKRKTI